jgi:hypothetical protein
MLNILGMIILIIILFIIILLILGIKISFEYVKKGSEVKGCLKITVFKKIRVYTHHYPSDDEDNEDEDKDEEKKQRDVKKILKLAKPCLKDLLNYIIVILKSINIKTLQNHFIYGIGSYADIGKNIGIIWAIFAYLNTIEPELKLSAEPSFTGTVLDAKGNNEFEIYPLKLVIPTIRLISKKEVRTLMRGVLDER